MMESGKSPKSIFHKIRADRVRSSKEQCFWLFNICLEGVGEILPDITADISRSGLGTGGVNTICHQIFTATATSSARARPGPPEQHSDNLNKSKRRFITIICGEFKMFFFA